MIKRFSPAFFSGLGALALFIPTRTMALEFLSSEVESELESTGLGQNDPEQITVTAINIGLGLLALVAVVLVITGGIMLMTSGGVKEKVTKAKKLLYAALAGLAIILAAWGLTRYVFLTLLDITG